MIRKIVFILFLFLSLCSYSQYHFEGKIADNVDGKKVYLSIIEDYRKLARPYLEQVIQKASVDSIGNFKFEGDNLSSDNRIYRLHIDECPTESSDANHFLGRCENSQSILFIANNNDSINFPTSFADEVLCEINSTNPKSEAFLQIDVLKEEMAFEYYEYPSEASRKLNSKKWFKRLQDFGKQFNEPLAELYVYDFLSDKRNETYSHYIKDLQKNYYYSKLGGRLEEKYPDAVFTELYQNEISADQSITNQNKASTENYNWLWALLIGLSVLTNLYFLIKQYKAKRNYKNKTLGKLTTQEQKIVKEILQDKTNKEIASDLFISLSTVKTHINNLYKKLGVTSREEIKQLLS